MEIGRNDPCPCGSGKKYKKCCLSKAEIKTEPNADEFKKRKWSAVQLGLHDKLLSHIVDYYGKEAIHEAYEQFQLYRIDTGLDFSTKEMPVFAPWFYYEWLPSDDSRIMKNAPNMSPGLSLIDSDSRLSDNEVRFLAECCRTSFSFFEILGVNLNHSLELKDILTDEIHKILEKKATESVQPGDVMFGKVIQIDGIGSLEACAPIIFKPSLKIEVLDLKKKIQRRNRSITQETLHNFAMEILRLYRSLYEVATNPPQPILTNTDGHLMIPHKLSYEINDANFIFEGLHDLNINETKEEILSHAKIDKNGNIISVKFPWLKKGNKKNKGWDNTVLGHIHIQDKIMTVDVNSKERAKKFQIELKKRLKEGWFLKSTVIESIEAQLKKYKPTIKERQDLEKNQLEMMNDPLMQEKMKHMMKVHWENWVSQPLPILGGLKPIDAAKTKDGRERLKALLTEFERKAPSERVHGLDPNTFQRIREQLGL